jgi:hypothetical protein
MAAKKEQPVYSLTNYNAGIASSIATPVEIADIISGKTVSTKGIWDTGATNSVITKSAAIALGVVPVTRTVVP